MWYELDFYQRQLLRLSNRACEGASLPEYYRTTIIVFSFFSQPNGSAGANLLVIEQHDDFFNLLIIFSHHSNELQFSMLIYLILLHLSQQCQEMRFLVHNTLRLITDHLRTEDILDEELPAVGDIAARVIVAS